MFKTGKIYMTKGINDTIADNEQFSKEVVQALQKYKSHNWGDLCEEDKQLNDEAIINGDRIVAAYKTSQGKIYIITEHDRSATTILFAEEY